MVEGTRLESVRRQKPTAGSNPAPSASYPLDSSLVAEGGADRCLPDRKEIFSVQIFGWNVPSFQPIQRHVSVGFQSLVCIESQVDPARSPRLECWLHAPVP